MENDANKYSLFLKNAKELNDNFGIIPLLYGSLGLEIITKENLNSDDIDILIPDEYVRKNKWEELKQFLESNGYKLIDEHEHTFIKDNIKYSYSYIEDLEPFANILIDSINTYESKGIKYKLLSLEQYLKVYERSSLDGYRINKKEKKDNEKIKLIKEKINNS